MVESSLLNFCHISYLSYSIPCNPFKTTGTLITNRHNLATMINFLSLSSHRFIPFLIYRCSASGLVFSCHSIWWVPVVTCHHNCTVHACCYGIRLKGVTRYEICFVCWWTTSHSLAGVCDWCLYCLSVTHTDCNGSVIGLFITQRFEENLELTSSFRVCAKRFPQFSPWICITKFSVWYVKYAASDGASFGGLQFLISSKLSKRLWNFCHFWPQKRGF